MIAKATIEDIDALHKILNKLVRQDQKLLLLTIEESEMEQSTKDLITAIDGATDKVATRIQALIDKAAAQGSVTAAEVNAALSPEVDKLNLLGQDPANPVPVAVG